MFALLINDVTATCLVDRACVPFFNNNMSSSQELAEEYKNKGNEFFKANKYPEALEQYTKAIELNPTAIYYSNRAITNIRMEQFGAALQDAEEAIKLDPNYTKVHLR